MKSNLDKTRRLGFTMTELLIVVCIIMVLAGFVLVGVGRVWQSTYRADAQSTIKNLYLAFDSYKTEFMFYPFADSTSKELCTDKTSSPLPILDEFDSRKLFAYDHKYLGASGHTLVDPWKQPYVCYNGDIGHTIDNQVSHPVKIYSAGYIESQSKGNWVRPTGSSSTGYDKWKDPSTGVILPVYISDKN